MSFARSFEVRNGDITDSREMSSSTSQLSRHVAITFHAPLTEMRSLEPTCLWLVSGCRLPQSGSADVLGDIGCQPRNRMKISGGSSTRRSFMAVAALAPAAFLTVRPLSTFAAPMVGERKAVSNLPDKKEDIMMPARSPSEAKKF